MNQLLRKCVSVTIIVSLLFISFAVYSESYPWDCPGCGRIGNTGNYCGGCAHPAPWLEETQHVSGDGISFGSISVDSSLSTGDIVKFGKYDQDNNIKNGSEDIEWIVLEIQDGKMLLISKMILDIRPYNNTSLNYTYWNDCTLRMWLNNDFLNTAFSDEEKSLILESTVDNSKSSGEGVFSSPDTLDKIFILSYFEANEKYYSSDESRKSIPTEYAKTKGKIHRWWLRSSSGNTSNPKACYVGIDGSIVYNNLRIDNMAGIRPAIWIKSDSDIV